MPERIYDHDEIIRLRRAGYSQPQIAEAIGCKTDTVSKVLRKAGMKTYAERDNLKIPILLEEIDQYREDLEIGAVIWLEERDDWDRSIRTAEKYKVTEKYPWFCVVRNSRGKERHILYIDLLMKERGKRSVEEDQ